MIDHRLAVYGSLAPGKSNHHMLAWTELDAFEGTEYARVPIDVFPEDSDAEPMFVANIYALATPAASGRIPNA